jgi:hypothetical protein
MILTYDVNIQIHVYDIKAPEHGQVFCRVLVARSLALSVLILNYASVLIAFIFFCLALNFLDGQTFLNLTVLSCVQCTCFVIVEYSIVRFKSSL